MRQALCVHYNLLRSHSSHDESNIQLTLNSGCFLRPTEEQFFLFYQQLLCHTHLQMKFPLPLQRNTEEANHSCQPNEH